MVLFSGALRHLRAHCADAEIVVGALPAGADYLRHCPHVDEVVVLSKGPNPPAELARRQWSVVLAPIRSPGPWQHRILGSLSATDKHGIGGDLTNQTAEDDQRFAPLYTSRLELAEVRKTEHELIVTRDFLAHLGIEVEVDDVWPESWTTSEDRRWAEEHVPRTSGRCTVAVAPGVSNPAIKIYPAHLYRSVFERPLDAPVDVVVFGGPADRSVCAAVAAAIAGSDGVGSVTDLAGTTTTGQMVEGLRRADAVLAVDAAPLHLATALRRPVVGVMGGGHYGRFYPWGEPHLTWVANRTMDCYWCNWRCRYETTRCVVEIPPSLIANRLRDALRASREPATR